MNDLTKLEREALSSIFAETPELAGVLEQQLGAASVVNRENTGGGFFTSLSVPVEIPPIEGPRLLAEDTFAQIDGLEHGIGFVLFMKEGYIHILEGYALAPEDTATLDLKSLNFTILSSPAEIL